MFNKESCLCRIFPISTSMFCLLNVFSRETKASLENRDPQEREVLASPVQRYACWSSHTDNTQQHYHSRVTLENCYLQHPNTHALLPSCVKGEPGSGGLAGLPGLPGEDGAPGQKVQHPSESVPPVPPGTSLLATIWSKNQDDSLQNSWFFFTKFLKIYYKILSISLMSTICLRSRADDSRS